MLLDFRLGLAFARWARELCSETSGELHCVQLQFLYALCCLHAAIFTPSFCRFGTAIPASLHDVIPLHLKIYLFVRFYVVQQ